MFVIKRMQEGKDDTAIIYADTLEDAKLLIESMGEGGENYIIAEIIEGEGN